MIYKDSSRQADNVLLNASARKTHNLHKFPWQRRGIDLSLVLLGMGATFLGSHLVLPNQSSSQPPDAQLATALENSLPPARPMAATDSNFITAAVGKVGPAVVRIDTTQTVKSQVPDMFNAPFFRQFFGSEVPTSPFQANCTGNWLRLHCECQRSNPD